MASKKYDLILTCLIASVFMMAGCGSKSNPTAPHVIDTAPPQAPTGLSAHFSPQDMTVTLIWDGSTSATHAGFVVERSTNGNGRAPLAGAPQAGTNFTDEDINYGDRLTYYVSAVDTQNNRSAEAVEQIRIFLIVDNEPAIGAE